ncbi:hypothetical protein VNO77_05211 [Canavalia gladiata]|uniref:Uncharacterized protein n=1 Tax=Canavalia gladiata TaxID=3824 RepID=A0AAN9N344_CANGL
MALCHYHIYRSSEEDRNPMPSDWFRFSVSIVYRSSSVHLSNTNYERFRFLNVPTIVCRSFFTQEGKDFLQTHLSTVQYFTSELLENILPPIASWIQGLFKFGNGHGVGKPLDSQPRVFSLCLDIEFELPCDHHEEFMQQVESIPASEDATESPRTEYCTICLGECQWCDGDTS